MSTNIGKMNKNPLKKKKKENPTTLSKLREKEWEFQLSALTVYITY